MKSSCFICFIVFLLASFVHAAETKPNVVLILADDLGWSDTTLYGTTTFYETPNIERLAQRGMTFSRAYTSSPVCSPTRAGILTGLHPARIGISTPSCHLPTVFLKAAAGLHAAPDQPVAQPNTATRLDTTYTTLPEVLKKAGYATGHFGKWHLGPEPYSPLEQGFDIDLPHHPGPGPAGSYVAPWKFKAFDPDPDTPRQHIEDRMAQEASRWMERHRDEPFFLNYWMFSVHSPFDAKKELIEKHQKRVDPADTQKSPTYAAMIESMDDAVGTLLDTIDRLGIADRTIIIFASDNGGNMYDEVDGTTPTSNRPMRGSKGTLFEGGTRIPCVIAWPKTVRGGSRSEQLIQTDDFMPTILDLLGIKSEIEFDGISIVPALKEKKLDREAIFTFFPHDARQVPDWLPPSVAMTTEEWKLIRVFHGERDGCHRRMLFNLHDDPAEKNDLAATEPERVKTMDEEIERFLVETRAVVPLPNPQFKPELYDPSKIGIPVKPDEKAFRRGPPVAGWRPLRDCSLKLESGTMVVEAVGTDPSMEFFLPCPLPAGEYMLELNCSSSAKGKSQFFWHEQEVAPQFARQRSVFLDTIHDGLPHEYITKFEAKHEIPSVRFDPAVSEGRILIRRICLKDAAGNVVHAWDYSKR